MIQINPVGLTENVVVKTYFSFSFFTTAMDKELFLQVGD